MIDKLMAACLGAYLVLVLIALTAGCALLVRFTLREWSLLMDVIPAVVFIVVVAACALAEALSR